MKQYIAGENEQGMRLLRFVKRAAPGLPNPLLYKAFRNKRIKINGAKANHNYLLNQGDRIELYINDEYFETTSSLPFEGKEEEPNKEFQIVWENKDIAILYKAPGILCHSNKPNGACLQKSFAQHLIHTGEYSPSQENFFTPALCNRLDVNTEGLVIGAKNFTALREMNLLIRENLVEKKYLCITIALPPQGIHQAYLLRDKVAKTVSIYVNQKDMAKNILTGIKTIDQHNHLYLNEITLLTGRTHQIRAHLAFLGAPLLGERKYTGSVSQPAGVEYPSGFQALAAEKLVFSKTIPADSPLSMLAGIKISAQETILSNWWKNWKGQTFISL